MSKADVNMSISTTDTEYNNNLINRSMLNIANLVDIYPDKYDVYGYKSHLCGCKLKENKDKTNTSKIDDSPNSNLNTINTTLDISKTDSNLISLNLKQHKY